MFLRTSGVHQERKCWLIKNCPEEQEDELTAADQAAKVQSSPRQRPSLPVPQRRTLSTRA